MKKLVLVLLTISMLLAVSGCSENKSLKSIKSNVEETPEPSSTMIASTGEPIEEVTNIPLGVEYVLATLKVRVLKSRTSKTISAEYSSPKTAKDGATFVIINMDVKNITKETFALEPIFVLIDDQGRRYRTYDGSIGNIDNYLDFKSLSPSIKETGNFVYEVPLDAKSYELAVGKAGTEPLEIYKVKLK